MRKELDNSYLAEVNESGKFLGKNKVEVRCSDSNVVSNVLSTIDGGVTLEWNSLSPLSLADGTNQHYGEPIFKAVSTDRIVPAGTLVVEAHEYFDDSEESKDWITFASFGYDLDDNQSMNKCNILYDSKKGFARHVAEPFKILGVLVNDVDFGSSNEVLNVAVAKCADVYPKILFNKLNKEPYIVDKESHDYIMEDFEIWYRIGSFNSLARQGSYEKWFDNLNLNIK